MYKSKSNIKVPGPVLQLGEPQTEVWEPGGEAEQAGVRQLRPRLRHLVHEQRLHQVLHVTADGQLALES